MKRHLMWVNIAVALAVVTLAAVLVWRQAQPDAGGTTPQRGTAVPTPKPNGANRTPQPPSDIDLGDIDLGESAPSKGGRATSEADGYGMSLAPSDSTAPINNVDPMTNKPIGPKSPTVLYKGHTIAFCCANSSGYRGGWDRMSEAQKDAVVARFVK